MARDVLLCVLLSLQFLQCLSQEKEPSVGEYFLEAVDWMNRTQWRYFLPEDTDIDQDGNLSDLEVQHKFNTYMGEVFKLMDQDKDNSITEEELRSLKLDIPQFTKIVDIALENFPLRTFFLAADANGDGVYDENDFYVQEKNFPEINYPPDTVQIDPYSHKVTLGIFGPSYGAAVVRIGQNEGTVICKSLGYDGLERVVEAEPGDDEDFHVIAYTCDGTEADLKDCQKVLLHRYYDTPFTSTVGLREQGMGVVCKGQVKLGALRLVGGKDSASGDIHVGKKGLTCLYRKKNAKVICRELGYSGVIRVTKDSAFTSHYFGPKEIVKDSFHCEGNEQRLADCPYGSDHCYQEYGNILSGIICATDERSRVDQGLRELLDWEHNARIWEKGGRFLFIADSNGDGKLTLQELAKKSKQLMTTILELLDMTHDGKISVEDINLHLSFGPIQKLVLELFDDITADKGEFDLYNMEIAGQDMSKYWWSAFSNRGLKEIDDNLDEKLNAADIFYFSNNDYEETKHDYGRAQETKATFLLPILSQKLDNNQDGKIQREELRQFIDEMFSQLDMDKDHALTLEDAYTLLRESGYDCRQVGVLRSYIKIFIDTLVTETRNFFSYIFHQFDVDGNGKISSEELEQMYVPCGASDIPNNPNAFLDPNNPNADLTARKECADMFEAFFASKIRRLISFFPSLKTIGSDPQYDGRRGKKKTFGRDGMVRGQTSFYSQPGLLGIFADLMADHACEMLT